MNKVFKLSLLSAVLFAGSEMLHATTPGAYIGGGVGLGTLNSQQGLIKDNESAFGGRLFAGYNFNPFLGVEANYSALDKTSYKDIRSPFVSGDYSLNAISLVGKAYIPFSEPFNIYALLGVAHVYGKFDVVYNSMSLISASDNGFVPTAGLGANYEINRNFSTNLEISGFGENKPTNSIGVPGSALATLSLAYKFN